MRGLGVKKRGWVRGLMEKYDEGGVLLKKRYVWRERKEKDVGF